MVSDAIIDFAHAEVSYGFVELEIGLETSTVGRCADERALGDDIELVDGFLSLAFIEQRKAELSAQVDGIDFVCDGVEPCSEHFGLLMIKKRIDFWVGGLGETFENGSHPTRALGGEFEGIAGERAERVVGGESRGRGRRRGE